MKSGWAREARTLERVIISLFCWYALFPRNSLPLALQYQQNIGDPPQFLIFQSWVFDESSCRSRARLMELVSRQRTEALSPCFPVGRTLPESLHRTLPDVSECQRVRPSPKWSKSKFLLIFIENNKWFFDCLHVCQKYFFKLLMGFIRIEATVTCKGIGENDIEKIVNAVEKRCEVTHTQLAQMPEMVCKSTTITLGETSSDSSKCEMTRCFGGVLLLLAVVGVVSIVVICMYDIRCIFERRNEPGGDIVRDAPPAYTAIYDENGYEVTPFLGDFRDAVRMPRSVSGDLTGKIHSLVFIFYYNFKTPLLKPSLLLKFALTVSPKSLLTPTPKTSHPASTLTSMTTKTTVSFFPFLYN